MTKGRDWKRLLALLLALLMTMGCVGATASADPGEDGGGESDEWDCAIAGHEFCDGYCIHCDEPEPEWESGEPEDGEPEDGEPEDGEPEDGEPEDGEPEDGEPVGDAHDCSASGHDYGADGFCLYCGAQNPEWVKPTVEDDWDCGVDGHAYGDDGYCIRCGAQRPSAPAVSIGDYTLYAGFTAAAGSEGTVDTGEVYGCLVDGVPSSTWRTIQSGSFTANYIEFNASFPIVPKGYILYTGNDAESKPNCLPSSWTIKAKLNAGDEWTILASVSNDTTLMALNTAAFQFALDNGALYQYFRFEVTAIRGQAVNGDYTMELGELQFYGTAFDPDEEPGPSAPAPAPDPATAEPDEPEVFAAAYDPDGESVRGAGSSDPEPELYPVTVTADDGLSVDIGFYGEEAFSPGEYVAVLVSGEPEGYEPVATYRVEGSDEEHMLFLYDDDDYGCWYDGFIMPAAPVYVTVTLGGPSYQIEFVTDFEDGFESLGAVMTENGALVPISSDDGFNWTFAHAGSTVALRFEEDGFVVTDVSADGVEISNNDGVWSFVMPPDCPVVSITAVAGYPVILTADEGLDVDIGWYGEAAFSQGEFVAVLVSGEPEGYEPVATYRVEGSDEEHMLFLYDDDDYGCWYDGFIMPAAPVYVTVTLGGPSYQIEFVTDFEDGFESLGAVMTENGALVPISSDDGFNWTFAHAGSTVALRFEEDGFVVTDVSADGVDISCVDGVWSFVMPADHPEVSITATSSPAPLPAATLKSYSLTLEGQIGLNYTVKIPEAIQDSAQAVLSCKGKETALALGEPLEGTTDEFRFTYRVPAKGIGNEISLRIADGSGNTLPLMNSSGEAYADSTAGYSVAGYCKVPNLGAYAPAGKGEALEALAASLQNYGAFALAFFGSGDTSPGFAADTQPDLSGVAVTGFGVVKNGALEGLSQTTMFLTLQSETTINLRFVVGEGHSIDEYSFSCGETALTPVPDGGSYLVKLENIPAKDLDTAYTVTVRNGNNETFTISCSALSYAQLALNDATLGRNAALCSALKALYLYNQAANDYFEN